VQRLTKVSADKVLSSRSTYCQRLRVFAGFLQHSPRHHMPVSATPLLFHLFYLSCVYPPWPLSVSRQIRLQQDIAEAGERIRDLEAETLKQAKAVPGRDQSEICRFFFAIHRGTF
jgi:hypothetical protein